MLRCSNQRFDYSRFSGLTFGLFKTALPTTLKTHKSNGNCAFDVERLGEENYSSERSEPHTVCSSERRHETESGGEEVLFGRTVDAEAAVNQEAQEHLKVSISIWRKRRSYHT